MVVSKSGISKLPGGKTPIFRGELAVSFREGMCPQLYQLDFPETVGYVETKPIMEHF